MVVNGNGGDSSSKGDSGIGGGDGGINDSTGSGSNCGGRGSMRRNHRAL